MAKQVKGNFTQNPNSYLVKYLEMRKNEGKADSLVRTAGTFLFRLEKELLLVLSKPR